MSLCMSFRRSSSAFAAAVVALAFTACTGVAPNVGDDDGREDDGEGGDGDDDQTSAGGGAGSGGTAGKPVKDPPAQAGGGAGGGAPDAGSGFDDTPTPKPDAGAAVPPAGKVPMFVAAGHGARTVTSCDDGKTWIANHVLQNANVDHSPYTEKGFVYGNGLFVHLVGWGAPGSVKVSRNGVDWKLVSMPKGGDGGLAFLTMPKPAFVALGGYGGCQTSADGETWSRCTAPGYPENLREAGGGGSVLGVGGDIPAVFSFDGGKQWRGAGGCALSNGFGNLGQEGGFAFGNGVFVAMAGNGDWCSSADQGKTWKTGKLGGGAGGKMTFTGGRFWAPNGREASFSEDGVTWQRVTFQPAGVSIHSMARGDSGTYVGVERSGVSNRFFRSTDGVTWTTIMGPGGTSLRRVAFGYGEPSEKCPLP